MVGLTPYLDFIEPDPIRFWVKVAKDAGAANMTIGVPDRLPQNALETYAKAVYDAELKGATGYPPFDGEEALKDRIIEVENNFGAKLSHEDKSRIFVTVGASQSITFVFSLFEPGSEILVNTPCWGTIFNMAAHSGNRGVPVEFFVGGKFRRENADAAFTLNTRALYVNFPANPTGSIVSSAELKKLCEWAVSKDLQIISDEPYKYILFDRSKTPYSSPVSFGQAIGDNVTLISSFSKIVKPDIRLGFMRISPTILSSHKMIGFYFRNLSAGASASEQAGVTALIASDPKLTFLAPVVEGYRKKSAIVEKYMLSWGCKVPYKPDGTYMMFPTTPDGSESEDFVRRTASEKKVGFVPGTSFGGKFEGFEDINRHFRIGFGGGMSKEKVQEIMEALTA